MKNQNVNINFLNLKCDINDNFSNQVSSSYLTASGVNTKRNYKLNISESSHNIISNISKSLILSPNQKKFILEKLDNQNHNEITTMSFGKISDINNKNSIFTEENDITSNQFTIKNISENKNYLSYDTQNEKLSNSSQIKFDINSFDTFKNNKSVLNSKTISIYSQMLLLKLFNEFLKSNKPVVFDSKTEDKKIMGFSAFDYDNKEENKTLILIDINLLRKGKGNNGYNHYFTMYKKGFTIDFLKKLIILGKMEQIEQLKKISEEFLMIKVEDNNINILRNLNLNLKQSSNYLSILSSYNSSTIKILQYQETYEYDNNFDYILLLNKGIYKNIYCIEINQIIYETLKDTIKENKSFKEFLNNTDINILKRVIENGGKNSMSMIFICLQNIYELFKKKNLEKIEQILYNLSITSYEIDSQCRNFVKSNTSKEINLSNNHIKKENCVNITFKMKTLTAEFDKISEKNKKKKSLIFTCC